MIFPVSTRNVSPRWPIGASTADARGTAISVAANTAITTTRQRRIFPPRRSSHDGTLQGSGRRVYDPQLFCRLLALRVAAPHRAIQDAQRCPQCKLGDDRENSGLTPLLVDLRPVVERRDDRAVALLVGLEAVAADGADLGPDLTQNRPRDQPVGLEFADGDGDVVLAKVRKVVESVTVHVHDEAVTDGAYGRPVGVLQHSGRVDGDVTLRIAEDGEDFGCWSGDRALDFDFLGHGLILSGRLWQCRNSKPLGPVRQGRR